MPKRRKLTPLLSKCWRDLTPWSAPGICAVIPQGPGDGRLEPGDVVVEVNGECCTTFLPLAECFDSHVGQIVSLRVQRGGEVGLSVADLQDSRGRCMVVVVIPLTGPRACISRRGATLMKSLTEISLLCLVRQERVVEVPVQDLHSIIPDEFFQVRTASQSSVVRFHEQSKEVASDQITGLCLIDRCLRASSTPFPTTTPRTSTSTQLPLAHTMYTTTALSLASSD